MRVGLWALCWLCTLLTFLLLPCLAEINASDSSRKNIIVAPLDAGGFITLEKKAYLSGIRVEADEPGYEGFIGYTEKGVSIVKPDTIVRIVLFGWWLDEVILIGFTDNDNCTSTTVENILQAAFTIQTEKRVVVRQAFPQTKRNANTLFKICMKQKPRETHSDAEKLEMPFSLVDDLRSSISTDLPPRNYYFPIGVQIGIICSLLILSGLFSGLNLGLMALTPQELMLISKSGSKQERIYAETILPVRKSGNLLLCSLLIGNVCVNSAISILFDDLTSGYVALIVSSLGIVVFGEIFPQALCVKKGLAVGAHTIQITRFFMIVTFPLAYPISRILDIVLGVEVVSYDRKRIMELIKMSTRSEEGLAEELKIAVGAMEISDKTVSDVMTRADDVFMLPDTTVLNTKTVAEILRMGYTRIPVYAGISLNPTTLNQNESLFLESRNNVVSLLFVKDLALLDPDDNFTVKMVCGYHDHQLRFVLRDTPLRVMLEEFKKGDYHLALVEEIVEHDGSDPMRELVGIVTLEDILEEILQAEIVDETDAITDNVHRIRRRRAQEHEFSHCLLDNDVGGACLVSMQMQLVTVQWLATNHPAFSQDFIGHSTLEKVIRQHVHKVELSHLADMNDPKMVYPRISRLYTKKEPSDKFILILEGRAIVTIGQNAMTFEASPWHCFGNELLDKLLQVVQQNQQQNPQKPLNSRNSQGALSLVTSGASAVPAPVQPFEPDAKKITFVPDYSAVIRDDCTYLEISAQTYLLAYKSTLLSRQKNEKDLNQTDPLVLGAEIPVNQITSEGYLEEVALLRSNGSLRKRLDDPPRKRTNSESNTCLVDQEEEDPVAAALADPTDAA